MPTWGDGHGAGGIVDVVDARQGNQPRPWRGGRGSASPLQGVGGVSPVRHWCGTGWRHRPRPVGVRRLLTLRPGGSVDPRRWSRQCSCRSPCGRSGTDTPQPAVPNGSRARRAALTMPLGGLAMKQQDHEPHWDECEHDDARVSVSADRWCGEDERPRAARASDAALWGAPKVLTGHALSPAYGAIVRATCAERDDRVHLRQDQSVRIPSSVNVTVERGLDAGDRTAGTSPDSRGSRGTPRTAGSSVRAGRREAGGDAGRWGNPCGDRRAARLAAPPVRHEPAARFRVRGRSRLHSPSESGHGADSGRIGGAAGAGTGGGDPGRVLAGGAGLGGRDRLAARPSGGGARAGAGLSRGGGAAGLGALAEEPDGDGVLAGRDGARARAGRETDWR
jgi:hypothetical protein